MDDVEIKRVRQILIGELFRGNIFNLFMTLIAALCGSVSSLIISWLIKDLVDLMAGTSTFTLYELLLFAAFGFALQLVAAPIDHRFLSRFRAKSMEQYRAYAFDRLLEKGIRAFSGEDMSVYLSALSNDASAIEQDLIMPLQSTVETALTFVGSLALMLWLNPLLTLIAIAFSLLPLTVSVVLGNKAAEAEKVVSDQKGHYTGLLKDMLTGFAVIKSSKAEHSISRMHGESNAAVADASNKRTHARVLVSYSSSVAGGLMQFGVFFVAAALALSGSDITGGTVLVFVQLMNYVLAPIQVFPTFYAGAKSSFVLVDKLARALSQNVPDEGEPIDPELTEGISVRGLGFSYDEGKEILHDVNLEFDAGGCYALVGESGSGKSTILNLLMASSREYRGEILYDGTELKTVSPSSLYDLVSIIQQDVFVFNSTIRDNITMFSDFPLEEVDKAVRTSGLSKLIDENGEDYLCGDNGSGLSGGERQRVSIARALLRGTPVLFVDEATASLDAESSFGVLDAILRLDGFTRVIITHDLDENILRRCAGLYVLKGGTVIERGTFDELMGQKGYFYSLFTVSR